MLKDNTNKIIEEYNRALENAINEIAMVGLAQIQLDTPVLTGNLRRSYTYKIFIENKHFVVVFGTNIPYSIYLELKPQSNGGRPHLRPALQSEVEEFKQILIKHLNTIGK